MTFSDAETAALVNREFVCAWENLQPGFDAHKGLNERFKDAAACRTIPEGHSDKNIVTVFATPDLKVLHVLPGYWQPARFKDEVQFVLALRKELLTKELTLREDRAERFQELHKAHAKQHAEAAEKAKGQSDPMGDLQRAAGYGRTKSALEQLLAGVHEDRAKRWGQTAAEFRDEFRAGQIGDFFGPKK